MSEGDSRSRVLILVLIFTIIWFLVLGRLFYLQVINSEAVSQETRKEQLRKLTIEAKRGDIYDRNGKILATDLKMYTLYVKRDLIDNPRRVSLEIASSGIGDTAKILDLMRSDSRFIRIARGVPDSIVEKINIEGVYAFREWYRYYPSGNLGRSFLGSLNWKRNGIMGMEREYNEFLKGKDGWAYYLEVPRYSGLNLLKRSEMEYRDPVDGRDLYLSIDLEIQQIMDYELRKLREETEAEQVLGICLSVKSGEILSMVNLPEFNPDEGWRSNSCTAWEFEPGSIFKIVPALAYLKMGYSVEDTVVDTTFFEFGGKNFEDPHPHSAYTFREAFAHSSNSGFVSVGKRIGKKEFYSCARLLGIGCKTGVDLPVEYSGKLPLLPDARDVRLATVSFGQGVSVTPLQIVSAYQAIANRGVLLRPRLRLIERSMIPFKGDKPVEIRRVCRPELADKMLSLLHEVTVSGTGKTADFSLLKVAGKTGTAWKVGKNGYIRGQYISSFIGVFPYKNPEFVIGIFIDNMKGTYYASLTACPAFREIARKITFLKNYRGRML